MLIFFLILKIEMALVASDCMIKSHNKAEV
jgi:hypothetical protein